MNSTDSRKHMSRRAFATGAAAASAFAHASMLRAQTAPFPSRPIRIVFPFGAGGGPDTMLRLIARKVEEQSGASIVIENRPGAGGTVALGQFKQIPADGYTLVQGTHTTHATNPALLKNPGYDPVADFDPITLLFVARTFIFVPTSLGVSTLAELHKLAKTKPSGLSYASPGIGSGAHLGGAQLAKAFGVPMTHVPYRGSAAPRVDLIAGRVDFMFNSVQPFLGDLQAGTLKAIALASRQRFSVLPDVPTVAEAGYPPIEMENWFGLFAPAGTPAPILDKLRALFVAGASAPDVRDAAIKQGFLINTNSRAEFASFVKQQIEVIGKIVREANISL